MDSTVFLLTKVKCPCNPRNPCLNINYFCEVLSLDSSDTREYLTFDSLKQSTTTSRDV